jgi:HK97 family phage major capsid protein
MEKNVSELSLLRDEVQTLEDVVRSLGATAKTRDLTEKEGEDFDNAEAELVAKRSRIESLGRAERSESLTNAKRSTEFGVPAIGRAKRKPVASDYLNGQKAWLLSGYEQTKNSVADDWKRSADIIGQDFTGKQWQCRDQATDVEGKGQVFVEDSIYRGFVEAKQAFGGLLEIANVQNYPTNERSRWAIDNDVDVVGKIQATQNAALTGDDVDTDEVFITPKMYYSKTTKISVQSIKYGKEDMFAYYGRKLGRRLLKKINVDLTTALLAGVHTTTYGYSNNLTYQNLGDLAFSLDPDYQVGSRVAFMGNQATKHHLWEQFADPTEGPTWGDALNTGPQANLMNVRYATNQQMPTMVSGQTRIPLVYGDFDNFIIHTVGTPTLVRLNELYMDTLSVGVFLYWEVGGAVIDAGTHPLVALTTGTLSGD